MKDVQAAKPTIRDSIFKTIFQDAGLFTQFIRDYYPYEFLKNIRPEDTSNMPTEYVQLQEENQYSDVIKKIRLPDSECFVIALTEHQSSVDYNMSARIFIYTAHIWTRYIAECDAVQSNVSHREDFRLPLVLPIVYHDGAQEWKAATDIQQRIRSDAFLLEMMPPMPSYKYWVMPLHEYRPEELLEHKNALSLILHLDRVESLVKASEILLDLKVLPEIDAKLTDHERELVAQSISWLLRRYNVPEAEIADFTKTMLKKGGTTTMFEQLPRYDVQEVRREAELVGEQRGEQRGELNLLRQLYLGGALTEAIVKETLSKKMSTDQAAKLMTEWKHEQT